MSHICTIEHHCAETSVWWKETWEMTREHVDRLREENDRLTRIVELLSHAHDRYGDCE